MKTLASSVRSTLLSAQNVSPLYRLPRESILFQQHQDGAGLFLVESGLVKLIRTSENGRRLILSVIGSHQVAGDESLTDTSSPYLADVVCLTDVSGYHIPSETVEKLLSVPGFAKAFLSYTMVRDYERIRRIELLASYNVEHRILHGLAELAQLVEPNADGASFAIPITQAEIASYIGATRETTSTTLSNLHTRGLVTLGRRLITTVHPSILMAAAKNNLAHRAV